MMDQDSAFMFPLMNYLLKKLDINIITVAPYNHQSLQAEHGIKSLPTILTEGMASLGKVWLQYLPPPTFAYNMFNTTNLANYRPYELVFSRKPKLLLNLETMPDTKVTGTFKHYYGILNERCQYLHKLL